MYCTKCGKKNEEGAAYCYACGQKLFVPKTIKAPEGTEIEQESGAGEEATAEIVFVDLAKEPENVPKVLLMIT